MGEENNYLLPPRRRLLPAALEVSLDAVIAVLASQHPVEPPALGLGCKLVIQGTRTLKILVKL